MQYMSLTNAIDALAKQMGAAKVALARHSKLIRLSYEKGCANQEILESLRACRKEQKALVQQAELTLEIAMSLMGRVAKVTHDSGRDFAIRIERLKQSSRESEKGRNARKGRTEKENFAPKKDELRRIWLSGKYTTKARCAEEEYLALGISYDTARKALRNLPKIKGASTK
jgi:outer membrane receptor for ferrienterochelin and colicin